MSENSTVSGDIRKGKAYVAYQPGENSGTSVKQMNMSNFNRDGYVANGLDTNNIPIKDALDIEAYDDMPIAEAIDLEGESGDDEKGSVRRL